MTPAVSTVATTHSLVAYLIGADLVNASSQVAAQRVPLVRRDVVERSFRAAPPKRLPMAGVPLATNRQTAVSEDAPIFIGAHLPEDAAVAEVNAFRNLPASWDGEQAEKPNQDSILDAVRFLRLAGPLAERLEPTLHVDGSVLLEIDSGAGGSLRFRGGKRVAFAIAGREPGEVEFNDANLPDALRMALDI